MNWRQIMADLRAAGWTQVMLAEKAGCGQATIADLARGKTQAPSYEIGKVIVDLHKRVQRAKVAA